MAHVFFKKTRFLQSPKSLSLTFALYLPKSPILKSEEKEKVKIESRLRYILLHLLPCDSQSFSRKDMFTIFEHFLRRQVKEKSLQHFL